MNQKKLSAFFCALFTSTLSSPLNHPNDKKYIIGCHMCGFFANFMAVINKLDMCEKNNLTPVIYWDSKSVYYQEGGFNESTNVWEYYFQATSTFTYNNSDPIDRQTSLKPPFLINPGNLMPNKEERLRAFELIQKYAPLKPFVKNMIDDFWQQNNPEGIIVGIHMRGTDKIQEVQPVDPQKIFDAANRYAQSCSDPVTFLVASDEQRLIDIAQKCLHGPVISYNAHRSTDGKPIHLTKQTWPALIGLDILIEALLLSSCTIFFHTMSNVAKGVLMFNPYLEHVCLVA